ncbi:Uncharacterized protein conserved in bacteria [Dermatophilus congolensis]|uniref:Uncharacterized protein conserved in bacteria n=1 Tax=Dermatophilus congolensis TaxID=1863 RepID=A0AA46BQ99_9MICO|nr:heparinase II/III family protein [Dermatophilus congolensis]STD15254.1 Uncharacterized protein conserved in bacteria [Dermatophilus congolensis]
MTTLFRLPRHVRKRSLPAALTVAIITSAATAPFLGPAPLASATQTHLTSQYVSAAMNYDQAGKSQHYVCRSFGSLPSHNPKKSVEAGYFSWPETRKAKVGTGQNINWKADPYKDKSWRTWFHSLMWIGSLVEASTRSPARFRDPSGIDKALAITQDWVKDNPSPWPTGPGAGNATHTRVDAIACLRAGLIQLNKPIPAWLDASVAQHAEWLKKNTWPDHNVGTEQTLAVMGVGCMLRRHDYTSYAASKLASEISRVIDTQGANNEQSTGYARWNWDIWGDVDAAITECDINTSATRTIQNKRAALATFLDHATKPDGYLTQLGDTKRETAATGTPAQAWIASNGTQGAPLPQRVKVYSAGYAFGRSGWGTPAGSPGRRPAQEAMYALRFGPRRAGHGHNDHTSFTWNSNGREILGDPGTGRYEDDAWRDFYTGPAAHNQLVITNMKTAPITQLRKTSITTGADYYRLNDAPLNGVKRQRDVIFLSDPDIVITVDTASEPKATSFAQMWHFPAGQKVSLRGNTATATTPNVAGKTTMLTLPAPGASSTKNTIVAGKTRPIQGWMWKNHFSRSAAPVISRALSGRSARIATAFVSSGSNDRVSMNVTTSGTTTIYTFQVGRRTAGVALSADGTLSRLPR